MSGSAVALVSLVGLLGWWSVPPVDSSPGRTPEVVDDDSWRRPIALVPALAAVTGWLLGPRGVDGVIVAAGLLLVGAGVQRVTVGAAARRDRDRRRAQVLQFCDALSAELHAGLPTPLALERACAGWAELDPVAAVARLGGDVSDALRALAGRPGAAGLAAAAAAWEVAGRSGTGLAAVLDRVTEALRHEEDAAAEVTAALGPPRATARMLMVLPILGVGLGYSMGADPLDFLLTSTAGLVCLFAGTTLGICGVLWVERLAAAAEA